MNKKYVAVGTLSFVVGVLFTVLAFYLSPRLSDRVARFSQPTNQIQVWNDFSQTQRQMLDHFDQLFREDLGESWFQPFTRNTDLGVSELTQREDDKYVYFDLHVDDIKSTTIQSKIENGYLTVSGTVEKKDSSESVERTYKSEFHRTFPLPENIDPQKMEVISENNRVTFRFPKV